MGDHPMMIREDPMMLGEDPMMLGEDSPIMVVQENQPIMVQEGQEGQEERIKQDPPRPYLAVMKAGQGGITS
jgi:hypothetical protein